MSFIYVITKKYNSMIINFAHGNVVSPQTTPLDNFVRSKFSVLNNWLQELHTADKCCIQATKYTLVFSVT